MLKKIRLKDPKRDVPCTTFPLKKIEHKDERVFRPWTFAFA